jgi:hypothetical protein
MFGVKLIFGASYQMKSILSIIRHHTLYIGLILYLREFTVWLFRSHFATIRIISAYREILLCDLCPL